LATGDFADADLALVNIAVYHCHGRSYRFGDKQDIELHASLDSFVLFSHFYCSFVADLFKSFAEVSECPDERLTPR